MSRRLSFRSAVASLGAAGLALALVQGCGGDGGPADPDPDPDPVPVPGILQVRLTSPNPDDGGILLTVSGPGIQSLQATGGLTLYESGTGSTRRALLAGDVGTGVVLRIQVADLTRASSYAVTVDQVAARSTWEQRAPGDYSVTLIPLNP